MGTICINRSGKALAVTAGPGVGTGDLGTLRPNEVYTWLGAWPGNGYGYEYQLIYFKTSNGQFKEGYIMTAGLGSAVTPITDCCLFKVLLQDGSKKNTHAFDLRRPVNMYDSSGNFIRTVPSNTYIFTNNGLAGQTHKSWMYIDLICDPEPVDANAFIDIGNGSLLFNECPLVGKLN